MNTNDFDYQLPVDLIAQEPLPRGQSRLLVLHRSTGVIEHRSFSDLLDYMSVGDVLTLNDSRVTARRLRALLDDNLEGEALLLRPVGLRGWTALVRPGRKFRPGKEVRLVGPDGTLINALIGPTTPEGGRHLELATSEERDSLKSAGSAPLPPYITLKLQDESRYQTVYADQGGSAAAPTAGLHFTDELLRAAKGRGVQLARITLHVGIDTFRPVRVDSIEQHEMHGEEFSVSGPNASLINGRTGRLFAVGTTTVRALESAADMEGRIRETIGSTHVFIHPGYRFRATDAILTNFHLPKSTLLMMISAFAGRDRVMAAYQEAIRSGYRFYSFGDAMLIL